MKRAILIILALTLILSGCNKKPEPTTSTFEVLTSFTPIFTLTMKVADGAKNVRVSNMAVAGGCLHDYQLTVSDMKNLDKCNAFIINGAGMESFIDKATQSVGEKNIIIATRDIELLTKDGHTNPHAWMSPKLASKMVLNIARELSALNPENKEIYTQNAQKYAQELVELGEKMKKQLEMYKNKNIITFHESFDYLAQELGLNVCATLQKEGDAEPTAAEINNMVSVAEANDVKAVFVEKNASTDAARTVAREAKIRVFTYDAVTSGKGIELYTEAMEQNIKKLKEALKDG